MNEVGEILDYSTLPGPVRFERVVRVLAWFLAIVGILPFALFLPFSLWAVPYTGTGSYEWLKTSIIYTMWCGLVFSPAAYIQVRACMSRSLKAGVVAAAINLLGATLLGGIAHAFIRRAIAEPGFNRTDLVWTILFAVLSLTLAIGGLLTVLWATRAKASQRT